eukprot:gnl/TRDRNA2_/TRDRNA2_43419_c0_seq1.p1 gnl/TRDRNA2_/TRDRNA2_43419_c0~~gnl/TRDRNA2_/TRDRNA2_43419_c0_seq1.p1  ORF type:complete len:203 (-),score=50.98 gnl/TRDRNA2_/TRDRNA2_43419_c0_seq1:162-770(-)
MREPAEPRRGHQLLEGLKAALEDEDFLIDVAAWAWEWSQRFPLEEEPRQWEHPLLFTTLHNEYRALFEDRATEYLEGKGVEQKAILQELQEALQDRAAEGRALLDALSASEDYLGFCRYMQQVRHRREWAEGRAELLISSNAAQSGPVTDGSSAAGAADGATDAGDTPLRAASRRKSGSDLDRVPEEAEREKEAAEEMELLD